MKRESHFLLYALAIGLGVLTSCERHREVTHLDSSTTIAAQAVVVNQGTNKPDNWHWDQAKADALIEKANRDQNITEMLEYAQMLYEAKMHGMPDRPSEFPFPNAEAGPQHPLPDYVNFYSIDDRYPAYLLCEYPVEVVPYDQSKEPGWFKEALKQVRSSGPKKFPPLEWVAIIIRNRAEHKGVSTFEQSFKVGAIFKASDVFESSHNLSQLIAHADFDRHPFLLDQQYATPGKQQRWVIVERHSLTNNATTGERK